MFELKLFYCIRGKRSQCDTREMKVVCFFHRQVKDLTFKIKINMKIDILK